MYSKAQKTIHLRIYLLRAHGGKVGKPKNNLKLHLFGGISRRAGTFTLLGKVKLI